MVKHGGNAGVEWKIMICDVAWRQGEVPDEWRKTVIVLLHKGKGNQDECNTNKGISPLSV